MSRHTATDETRIAQQITSVLPDGAVTRLCTDDAETIRFSVAAPGLKLKTLIFRRDSLSRLAGDPAAPVKIEYLQRDILRSASRRSEFRYPRESRIVRIVRGKRLKLGRLAVAAV